MTRPRNNKRPHAAQAARPCPTRRVRRAACGVGEGRLRQPGAAGVVARPRNHRPRRRVRDRTHLRHLPHPWSAGRGHRSGRGTSAGQDRPRPAGPAAARAPTNCCAPASNNTPPCPPPSSRRVSNSILHEPVSSTACCAPSRAATRSPGWTSWRQTRPTDPVGHAAFVHAHPRWIAQAFADALGAGAGQLDALLASDDERPSVHLAARPGVLTAEQLAEQVDGTVGRYSPYAVYLSGGDPGRLAPIRDGAALVQDEGSQLVARALTLAELDGPDGGRWLDLCAGPGGKTALLAALTADGARVTAVEPAAAARRVRRAEHPRPAGRRAASRRPRSRAGSRLRPSSRRCAVHRAGRTAAQARGALAPSAR